jgi:hypothetical protein
MLCSEALLQELDGFVRVVLQDFQYLRRDLTRSEQEMILVAVKIIGHTLDELLGGRRDTVLELTQVGI